MGHSLSTVIALGAGAYHGYCDAQHIPIDGNLEHALTYWPATFEGALAAIDFGCVGLKTGGDWGCEASPWKDHPALRTAKIAGGATLGTGAGLVSGAAIGFAYGGIQTLVGYGLGYTF